MVSPEMVRSVEKLCDTEDERRFEIENVDDVNLEDGPREVKSRITYRDIGTNELQMPHKRRAERILLPANAIHPKIDSQTKQQEQAEHIPQEDEAPSATPVASPA